MRISGVVWAVREGCAWRARVRVAGKEDVTARFPCLAPWLEWTVSGGRVTGVVCGPVSRAAARKLTRDVPPLLDDGDAWAAHEWAGEPELVRAVCEQSWLGAAELLALLNAPAAPTGNLQGLSARREAGARLPRMGEYVYWPMWRAQVELVQELVIGGGVVVRRGEAVQGAAGPPLVTPCPATHAELHGWGLACTLVFPGEALPLEAPTGPVTLVGLEDCTLVNLATALEWLSGAEVTVLHRWEPRDEVPWRGARSPPLALEAVCTFAARAGDWPLLGDPPPLVDAGLAAVAGAVGLARRVPFFVHGAGAPPRGPVACGDTVYDGESGAYYVVSGIERPPGQRWAKSVRLGMVYGSGCMVLTLVCGVVERRVRSDSRQLTSGGDPPRVGLHVSA